MIKYLSIVIFSIRTSIAHLKNKNASFCIQHLDIASLARHEGRNYAHSDIREDMDNMDKMDNIDSK